MFGRVYVLVFLYLKATKNHLSRWSGTHRKMSLKRRATSTGSCGARAAASLAPAFFPLLWALAVLVVAVWGNPCPWRTAPWWSPRTSGLAGEYGYLAYRPPVLDDESGSIVKEHSTLFNNLKCPPISKTSASVQTLLRCWRYRAACSPSGFPRPVPARVGCLASDSQPPMHLPPLLSVAKVNGADA